MASDKYVDVTKAEFDAFIAAYPRTLERAVTRICDPPKAMYNDFSLGDWPDCVVAQVSLDEEYGNPNTYRVVRPGR